MAGEYGVRTSGTSGRLFADPQPGPDETSFQVDNTSEQYYNSAYYKLHQSQLQPVPPPRVDPPRMQLAGVLSAEMIGQIQAAGRITFHAVGDTGAAQARAIPNETGVADAMARDVAAGGPDTPAFFFHLGDVVYSFGEAQYYYDQFYEPLRAYDRPVFAIPGNHDGFPESAAVTTLAAFLTNFCAASSGPLAQCRGPGAEHHDPAGRVLHPGRALGLDHRPVHQRARGARGDLHPGRDVLQPDERRPARLPHLRADPAQGRPRSAGQPPRRGDRLPSPSRLRRPESPAARPGCLRTSTVPARPRASGRMRFSPATPISTSASLEAPAPWRFPMWCRGAAGTASPRRGASTHRGRREASRCRPDR